VGRPPDARPGDPAVIAGVGLTPGVSHVERKLSARATAEELWAPLDFARSPSGRDAIWATRKQTVDKRAQRRFSAYLGQARSFYFASAGLEVVSRPLASYYSMMNLAKAWLTLCDPATTDPTPPPAKPGKKRQKSRKLYHGTSDELDAAKQNYYFSQEELAFQASGVFAEIARRSGKQFFYAAKKVVSLAELAAYLAESHDDYETAIDKSPKLIPCERIEVFRGKVPDPNSQGKLGALWLRAEVTPGTLTARNISPAALTDRAHHFGAVYSHVWTDLATHSYESEPVTYKGPNPNSALPRLVALFEDSLVHVNRSSSHDRYFLVLDKRKQLLSQEAVAFAVMHHLSEMVRYRPEQVERLAGEKWSWLLSTWVPRALENSLLTYMSRILQQEFRIV
jgi:hypothetical protein